MPEELPGGLSSKKWEEMTLEEKVEDLNRRLQGSKNWPYRASLFGAAYGLGMLFMCGGALLLGWPVLWLSGEQKSWSEVIPGMVAGIIGAGLGLLAFCKFLAPSIRREWEASWSEH